MVEVGWISIGLMFTIDRITYIHVPRTYENKNKYQKTQYRAPQEPQVLLW